MTETARAVVIGGGIVGCATAYHLARLGWTEITLIEQHELTDGTTWHSAGFVTALRGNAAHRRLVGYLPEATRAVSAETGLDAGWRSVGGLRLASTPAGVDELRRQARLVEEAGIAVELRTAAAASSLAPILDLTGVQAAAWLPGDGFIRPKNAAAAFAAGAVARGVTIRTGVRVTGLVVTGKRVTGVKTTDGTIGATAVINAAGAAASSIGAFGGAAVPVCPINHQYAVTGSFDPPLDPDTTPTVRDPERNLYLRAAGGGLIIGGYAKDPVPAWPTGSTAPLSRPRSLAEPVSNDEVEAAARERVPGMPAVVKLMHGPEGFTPDGEPLVGPSGVEGLWVAAGMGLHGMGLAAGIGKTLAEQITGGAAEWDVTSLDPRRFGPFAHNRHWVTTRAIDAFRRTFSPH
ncbi:4-methylaminobutanoate oxidase (formaldehyde-forming) [Allocatelliglobosispora scoriae]|uniref:4-methylaminobutanoate oxidase (Formaldehyde-forming) n=1 Tax=Allocatelliglobosispora scoriae TaxID=643052 RepID=A0A841BXL2_9ACTN|nr:FAD-binding oxidoreductase [Allocatelliglobosispora scoriae]MBB5872266.1 4-methylaminobutanoate oxidase (formaldehyde-forming) [Allocatelliglobosispora scoriae]